MLVVFALLVAACGGGTSDTTAAGGGDASDTTAAGSDGSAEPTTVSLWIDDYEVNECVIDVISGSLEGTSVVLEGVLKADQWDVTRTAIAGGAGPDIVITPGPSVAYEMAAAGALAPLDSYVTSLGMDKSLVDWALKIGVVDGSIYSLPTELETMVLYYNKTLFADNGWEPPTTIDELMALSQVISDAGVIPFAAGNAEWRAANEWLISAFFNGEAGPDAVYDALTGVKSFGDPEFVQAVTTLNDIQQNGWFSGGLDRYYTITFDEFLAAFGNGDAAMDIEGSWRASDIFTYFGEEGGNTNEWDWVPFPSTSGEATYAIGVGATYSINANSEVQDAAAEVLAQMYLPETQAKMAIECWVSPAPVRITAEMLADTDERSARLFSSVAAASDAGNYGYLTWTFWPPKSNSYLYEEIERVWNSDITPQEYADGLAEIYTEEFEAGEAPPIPER